MPVVDIIELPREASPKAAQKAAPQPAQKPKVYLATPCYGCMMTVPYLVSLLSLQAACVQRGIELMVDFVGNESLVERARNILVARFLASDATHLFFVDADIAFHPNTALRLLEADKDVATAVYPKKAYNWGVVKAKLAAGDKEPVPSMGVDYNINIAASKQTVGPNGFVQVLDSATGFMMIKRAVLERMADHYREELYAVNDIPGQTTKDYVALFACMIDPESKRFLSEDYSFCRRYQQLGGDIWADIATPLSHLGTHMYRGDQRARVSAT